MSENGYGVRQDRKAGQIKGTLEIKEAPPLRTYFCFPLAESQHKTTTTTLTQLKSPELPTEIVLVFLKIYQTSIFLKCQTTMWQTTNCLHRA